MTKNNNVYVVLTGNFTSNQRQIVKNRCMVHISQLKEIYGWLIRNNPNYAGFKDFLECPQPIILEDDDSIDVESENESVEKQLDIQYWFPNNGDPTSNSVFGSQNEFIDSLLQNKEPTLIFSSTNYRSDYKITLPAIFPLHFPFGRGGLEEDRRNPVSIELCLKHFLKLSLSMFQRSDIILVISHIYF